MERLEAGSTIKDEWVAFVVHGAGGDLIVSGPVCCGDGFEEDGGCLMVSRKGVSVKWKGVWPAGCDNIEKGGDCGAVEGLEDFDEDEFLV